MNDQERVRSQASHLGHVGSRCLAKSALTHKTAIAVDAWCRRTSLNYTRLFWCSHSKGNVASTWTPAIPSCWAHSSGTAAYMGTAARATPSRWRLPPFALVGLFLFQPLDFVLDRQFESQHLLPGLICWPCAKSGTGISMGTSSIAPPSRLRPRVRRRSRNFTWKASSMGNAARATPSFWRHQSSRLSRALVGLS